jgi:glycosyltransferase involved in cell wall biosynthesis
MRQVFVRDPAMPRVTIGVPVYNAENLLEQCLENLAAQTFQDFKVIVLDNASTDGTRAIAERYAKRDPRFAYQRQLENRGALRNFVDVLALADTPYFMWRADDDLSDVNFVEELVRLLDDSPRSALAVGLTVLDKRGRRRRKKFPDRWQGEPEWLYRIRLLFGARAQWIYGLFRTEDVRASLERVLSAYRHLNAFDHLVLFPFLVSLRVAGTNVTKFHTGFVERPNAGVKGFLDPTLMTRERRDFVAFCRGEALRLGVAGLGAVLPAYAERSQRWLKILNARLRVALGEMPSVATKKYD